MYIFSKIKIKKFQKKNVKKDSDYFLLVFPNIFYFTLGGVGAKKISAQKKS